MKDGFYFPERTDKAKMMTGCGSCSIKGNRTLVSGKGKTKLLIIGSAPRKGKHFRGSERFLIEEHLESVDKKYVRCNHLSAVGCSTTKHNRKHIAQCRSRIHNIIETVKPKVILPLGADALDCLIGDRATSKKLKVGDSIRKWRGFTIPDRKFNAWIVPTYHPSEVLEKLEKDDHHVSNLYFAEDIALAVRMLKKKFPSFDDEKQYCQVIKTSKIANRYLQEVLDKEPSLLAFDYETTGLKPHAKGHKIICCSMCYEWDRAVAFPMDVIDKKLFKAILKNKRIRKIASNKKFEGAWSRVILKTRVKGWKFDTVIGSHTLDNRSYITSIKFQALIRYGIFDYDKEIGKFFSASYNSKNKKVFKEYYDRYVKMKGEDPDWSKNANSFNCIHKAPINPLLLYCGMDSLLEYRVAIEEMKELGI